ncbi:BPSL0067 family protein [Niveibacterium sp. SC-1]|uniref:BPSL0067 family protein n=1 Tax=Niveibacterium sp. SC-1 TaxID=3135646 RepID=UPI00311F7899
MPYIYEEAETLAGLPAVGTKQCVALVKQYTKAPASSLWREGATAKGDLQLKKGTAIATFTGGVYANHASGNHAAIYISQDSAGLTVVDQWSASGTIRLRRLPFLGRDKNGAYVTPSNNGDAFAVIE